MERARRLLRGLGRMALAVAWTVTTLAALAFSAYLHLQLPFVRPLAARWIGHLVSEQIRGTLRIGRLGAVSLDRVETHHVELLDPTGQRIVTGARLVLMPDLRAFRERGELRFSSAVLHGGAARLIDTGDGLPTLLQTFDARTPGADGGEPLHAIVDGIEIEGLTLYGDLLGVKGFRAEGLRARGHMDIAGDVRVRIDAASATLVRPFGFAAAIHDLRGTISSVDTEGVALEADLSRGAERARAKIRFAAPKPGAPSELDLEVQGTNLTPETLRALGFEWIGPLAAPLTGTLRMRGPTEKLSIEADLQTPAGNARVTGEVGAGRARVTIASDAVALEQALTEAPDVTVRGAVTIETKPGQPHPHLHAEIAPLVHRTLALPGFVVDAVLTEDGVEVERVYAQRQGADIEGSGHITRSGAIEMRVRARVADVARDPQLSVILPGTHGRLNADVLVRIPERGRGVMRFSGQMALDNVRYGMLSARRLRLSGRMGGDPNLPSLDLRVSGVGVTLGQFGLGDATLRVAGAPGRYRASGQFTRGGERAFHLDAEIAADRKGFVVNADPIELTVAENSWRGSLRNLQVIHGESVALELLRLASRSQRLEAHGTVRMSGPDEMEALLQDFDLAAVAALVGPGFPLQTGRTDTHLVVSGDIARPNVLLEGALREGTIGEVTGVNALYAIDYQDSKLELDFEADLGERGLLRAGGSGYLALVLADPREAVLAGTYRLDVSAEDFSLAVVPALRDLGIDGRLGGNFRVSGTPRAPDLAGSFVAAPFSAPGWAPMAFRGQADFANGVLDARVTVLDDRGALAVLQGGANIDPAAVVADPAALRAVFTRGPWRLRGQTAMRLLSEYPKPLTRPWPVNLGLDGQLERRDGTTSGLVRYGARWAAPLHDTDCAADAMPSAQGSLRLDGDRIEATIAAFAGTARFADATVTLGASLERWLENGGALDTGSVHAVARIEAADIERLPYLCEQGRGGMSGEMRLDAEPGKAPAVTARFDARFAPQPIRIGRARAIRVRSCDEDPLRAHLAANSTGNAIRIEGRMEGCHGGPTTMHGTLPVRWATLIDPRWDETGAVEGTVEFAGAQLRPFLRRTPGLHGGEAIAKGVVRVRGTPVRPRFEGELNVSGGHVYLVSPGQALESVDARFTLRGDWAKVERLSARSGAGTIEATGGLGFDGWVPRRARLGIRAVELPVQREGMELARLTGNAAVESEIRPDEARTAVVIHELLVRLPDKIERTLQSLDSHPDITVVTEEAPAITIPYPVKFAIDARRAFRVARDDLHIDLAAELAVTYADPDFSVGGYMELLRGDFEVLGKRFVIVQGSLRFDGTTDVNPGVRLVATHQPEIAGSSSVSVTVGGTLLEPEVTFSTDACPGDGGAVMYLVSGQCAADDPELAAETAAAQDAYASGVVGAVGAGVTSLLPRVGGFALAAESAGEGSRTRVSAGFAADDALPKWMRSFVQRVYVQGAVVTPSGEAEAAAAAADPDASSADATDTASPSLLESSEFMLQLYFPYHIVGSTKLAPSVSWGVDVTWEP